MTNQNNTEKQTIHWLMCVNIDQDYECPVYTTIDIKMFNSYEDCALFIECMRDKYDEITYTNKQYMLIQFCLGNGITPTQYMAHYLHNT